MTMLAAILLAAAVPQTSAELYFFSRPNVPSNIVGQVMGSPAAYSVPRSEDVAWLYEAACERRALKSGSWNMASNTVYVPHFGSWALAESNRFVRWTAARVVHDGAATTNIVVGWTTNRVLGSGVDTAHLSFPWAVVGANLNDALASPTGDDSGYLVTDDAALANAAQAFDLTHGYPAFTNVWTETASTNAFTNAISVITMPYTNNAGRTSWTNRWQVAATVPYQHPVTNITGISWVGMCFNGGVAQAYTNRLSVLGSDAEDLEGVPIAAWTVTNQYAWMDGMRRVGKTISGTLTPVTATNVSWSASGSGSGSSAAGTTGYEWDAYSAVYANKDSDGIHTTPSGGGSERAPAPDVQTLLFTLPLSTNVTRAGGVERLSRVQLWARAEIEAGETSYSFGNGGDFEGYYQTNTHHVASVPLGDAQISAPTNGLEAVSVSVDFAGVRQAACSAAGVPLHGRGWTPAVRFPLPSPEEEGDNTSTETTMWLDINISFVAIIDFKPWTKMPIGGTQ